MDNKGLLPKKDNGLLTKDGVSFLIPFLMITSCFALWGFANDVTSPMVKAFSKIFRMSVTEGAMVQVAFYLGYFVMAFPAALFIQRYTFKSGVLIGLGLYAAGALLFIPAKMMGFYAPFLLAYFIMTCGLSFLETSCNPFIYCMGSEETATQRLNLAQAFNPIGCLAGLWVAMHFIQAKMSPMDTLTRNGLTDEQFNLVKEHDLSILIQPYVFIGAVIIILLVLIRVTKMPNSGDTHSGKPLMQSLRELASMKNYREGVVAQFFYIGAQVMCWTFIIQYGTRVFMNEGMDEKAAEILSQKYNIAAMVLFTVSRFVCTWFLKYIQPGRLLSILAVIATVLTGGVILFTDRNGLICLVGISACMSLMFPTIYGIALESVDHADHTFGAAFLVLAIVGGAIMPPMQGTIIDLGTVGPLPAVNASFVLPFICFAVIATYGYRSLKACKH